MTAFGDDAADDEAHAQGKHSCTETHSEPDAHTHQPKKRQTKNQT
jgi:hypothetical protein